MKELILSLSFLILIAGPPQPPLAAEEAPRAPLDEALPGEVIFSFIRALPEAQAQRLKKGEKVRAWWTGKGFQFEDSSVAQDGIFLTDNTPVGGKTRQAVSFRVAAGSETHLIFRKVPPGRRLRVTYALADSAFGGKPPAFVHLEVAIGEKTAFKTQTNTKGWKSKTVDLVLPFLLHRPFALTVKIRSADPQPQNVLLYGHIE